MLNHIPARILFIVLLCYVGLIVGIIVAFAEEAHGVSRNMTVELHPGQYALLCNCGDSIKYNYGEVDNNGFRLLSQLFEILVHGPIVEVDEK